MKNIQNYLTEQDVDVNTLPAKLRQSIKNSEMLFNEWAEMSHSINDESPEEEKEDFADIEAKLLTFNSRLINQIESWFAAQEEKAAKAKEEEAEAAKKAKAEAQAKAEKEPEVEKAEEASPAVPIVESEPKKGFGIGTFLLGAAVLIATAGAVNLMRNKNG